jgi:hypothetical protein
VAAASPAEALLPLAAPHLRGPPREGSRTPQVAQQILRHADVETRLAIYTHVDLGDMREVLSRTFAANLPPTGSIPKAEALDQSRFTEKDRGLQ